MNDQRDDMVRSVLDRFDEYASDFMVRMRHGEAAGTAGGRVRQEADRLVAEYRGRIEAADGFAEAQRLFDAFREEARRLRP